eukprot:CAMPEP_0181467770 /NCGR_PEP_ID=MMETSP1110-20121109/37154_1 /TAXON_ID=174948 /ORGANISM="Symbiodinium sp., Strain CCMP421" /LENGTH=88 /DNA_ID=CAMNT_0023592615 /DNA_START=300 /DNA_END=563 /DNA_ORIENTATION=+
MPVPFSKGQTFDSCTSGASCSACSISSKLPVALSHPYSSALRSCRIKILRSMGRRSTYARKDPSTSPCLCPEGLEHLLLPMAAIARPL